MDVVTFGVRVFLLLCNLLHLLESRGPECEYSLCSGVSKPLSFGEQLLYLTKELPEVIVGRGSARFQGCGL